MERSVAIQAFRDFAAFLETHPEIPIPHSRIEYFAWVDDNNAKAHMAQIAAIPGGWVKDVQTDSRTFRLERQFGPIHLSVAGWRNRVCERKLVGTQIEPEHVIPAREEERVPAREVPIYEWNCPKLLEDEAALAYEQTGDGAA